MYVVVKKPGSLPEQGGEKTQEPAVDGRSHGD